MYTLTQGQERPELPPPELDVIVTLQHHHHLVQHSFQPPLHEDVETHNV